MQCTACKKDLRHSEAYGDVDEPLCWTCYSSMLAEIEDEERDERERILEIRRQYAGFCPSCNTALEIGVAEWSVGRTCPKCGYHDYRQLYAEIE